MSRILTALCLAWGLSARAGGAAEISRYATTIWLEGDGSALVRMEIDLPAGTAGPLALPTGLNDLSALLVTGLAGAVASAEETDRGARVMLTLERPLASASTAVLTAHSSDFEARVTGPPSAFGKRRLTYRVVNSSASAIARASATLVLPPGCAVSSIETSEPPVDESSSGPPFALESRDGRHALTIASSGLVFADALSVTFQFKQRRFPAGLLVGLFAAGALYLVLFRNLVRRSGGA